MKEASLHTAQRGREEGGKITVRQGECPAEILFKNGGGQDKAYQHGGGRKIKLHKNIADDCKKQHYPNVCQSGVEGVNADYAENCHYRGNDGCFKAAKLDEQLIGCQHHQKKNYIAKYQTGIDIVDRLDLFGQVRNRLPQWQRQRERRELK